MKKQIQLKFLLAFLLFLSLGNAYGQYCTTTGATSTGDEDIANVTLVGSFGTQINNTTSCYSTVPQYVDLQAPFQV